MFCNMFWTCFANVFFRHFLSERKMHSTVLRCIAQSVFCSFCAFCILYTCWSVLCCFVKNAKNTYTKHRKTPQNTAKKRTTLFLKNIHNPATCPPPRNLRVYCVLCAFATDLAYLGRKHRMQCAQYYCNTNTYCGCIVCERFVTFLSVLRAFCSVCFAT